MSQSSQMNPQVIAIGGAKGGVGRSVLTALTGIALAILLYAWRYTKNHRHPLIDSLEVQQSDQHDAAFRSRFFKVPCPSPRCGLSR